MAASAFAAPVVTPAILATMLRSASLDKILACIEHFLPRYMPAPIHEKIRELVCAVAMWFNALPAEMAMVAHCTSGDYATHELGTLSIDELIQAVCDDLALWFNPDAIFERKEFLSARTEAAKLFHELKEAHDLLKCYNSPEASNMRLVAMMRLATTSAAHASQPPPPKKGFLRRLFS